VARMATTKACVTLKTGPKAIPAGESASELRTRVAALLDADESLIAPAVVDVDVKGDESLAIIVRLEQEQDPQGADPPTNLAAARDAVIQVQRVLGGPEPRVPLAALMELYVVSVSWHP
jgi:hypothetical protein